MARQGMAWFMARHGKVWLGMARHGLARRGKAWFEAWRG